MTRALAHSTAALADVRVTVLELASFNRR